MNVALDKYIACITLLFIRRHFGYDDKKTNPDRWKMIKRAQISKMIQWWNEIKELSNHLAIPLSLPPASPTLPPRHFFFPPTSSNPRASFGSSRNHSCEEFFFFWNSLSSYFLSFSFPFLSIIYFRLLNRA